MTIRQITKTNVEPLLKSNFAWFYTNENISRAMELNPFFNVFHLKYKRDFGKDIFYLNCLGYYSEPNYKTFRWKSISVKHISSYKCLNHLNKWIKDEHKDTLKMCQEHWYYRGDS